MNESFLKEAIRHFDFARCITEIHLEELINNSKLVVLTKGNYIFQQGDEAQDIYLLLEGMIKIYKNTLDGKELLKSILTTSDIFGENSLSDQFKRENNAMITSYNAKILCISKQTIYNIVRKDPEVGVCLIKFLTTTIHHRDKRIESFMSDDAKDRVIQFLHSYATEYGQQVGGELLIKHDLTQQDIANYTGTSRQTVTTVLSDLKRKNKIFLRRKSILIRDLKNFSCG